MHRLKILSTKSGLLDLDSQENDLVILHDELDPILFKLGFRIWDIDYYPTLKESMNWVSFDNWFTDFLQCDNDLTDTHQIPIDLTYKLLGGRLISQA